LKFFIGEGKLQELKAKAAANKANLIIFDHELSPSQVRNLEAELNAKVVDRTSLILDIFAQHAHSKEGKLQVELAQTNYTLTHLVGTGVLMSRLGGGIGTRGPGETKLEMDRRRIRERISLLKNELESVRNNRSIRRKARKEALLPVAAVVGYTNSGKSTLLNALTGAEVLVQDKLFATLDPTVRRVKLPNEREILLTDTVGFVHKLPHNLVEAFHATLEEVTEADILLHVVDISHPYFEDQIGAVYRVLEELNAITKPIITVFNKIDKIKDKFPKKFEKKFKPAVLISAANKENLQALLNLVQKELEKHMKVLKFEIPIDQMNMVHLLHEKAEVKSEEYKEDRVVIKAKVDEITKNRFEKYLQLRN